MALGCVLAMLLRGTSQRGAWGDLGLRAPKMPLCRAPAPLVQAVTGTLPCPAAENQVLGPQSGQGSCPRCRRGGHGAVEPQLCVGGGRCRAAPTAHLPGLCFGAIYRAAVYICAISAPHGEGARK